MLVPKELVAWWVKHHSLRLHVLFNRKNNNNKYVYDCVLRFSLWRVTRVILIFAILIDFFYLLLLSSSSSSSSSFSSLLETVIIKITSIYVCPSNGPSDKNTRIYKIFSLYVIFGCIRTSIAPEDGDLRQNLLFLFR